LAGETIVMNLHNSLEVQRERDDQWMWGDYDTETAISKWADRVKVLKILTVECVGGLVEFNS
jgi:hypothetical protein